MGQLDRPEKPQREREQVLWAFSTQSQEDRPARRASPDALARALVPVRGSGSGEIRGLSKDRGPDRS